jgi:hypothetical protein
MLVLLIHEYLTRTYTYVKELSCYKAKIFKTSEVINDVSAV